MPETAKLDDHFVIDVFKERWPDIAEPDNHEKLETVRRAVATLAIAHSTFRHMSVHDYATSLRGRLSTGKTWDLETHLSIMHSNALNYLNRVAYPGDFYHETAGLLVATMGKVTKNKQSTYKQAILHHFSPLPEAPPFYIPNLTHDILEKFGNYYTTKQADRPTTPERRMAYEAIRALTGVDQQRPYSMRELLDRIDPSIHDKLVASLSDELYEAISPLLSPYTHRKINALRPRQAIKTPPAPVKPRKQAAKPAQKPKPAVRQKPAKIAEASPSPKPRKPPQHPILIKDKTLEVIRRYEQFQAAEARRRQPRLAQASSRSTVYGPRRKPGPKDRPLQQAEPQAADLPTKPIDPESLRLIPGVALPPDLVGGVKPPPARLESSAIDAYLQEIRRYRLLRAEEEVSLAQRAEAGLYAQRLLETWIDDDGELVIEPGLRAELEHLAKEGDMARKRLFDHNLRLVLKWALGRHQSAGFIDELDLIQAGNMGLLTAVRHFDFTRGNKFSSYAAYWIRQAVDREIHKRLSDLTMSEPQLLLLTSLERAERELAQLLGRAATIRELAENLNTSAEEIAKLQSALHHAMRLDNPIIKDEEGAMHEIIEDAQSIRPDAQAEFTVLHEGFYAALGELPERQVKILMLYFGLQGKARMTVPQIADQLQMTGALVNRQLHETIRLLRDNPKMQSFAEFFDES